MTDTPNDEFTRSFTIAKCLPKATLEQMRESVALAIQDGLSLEQFRDALTNAAERPTPNDAPVLPAGVIEADGEHFMRDPRGILMPLSMIKAQHRIEDEVVRKVFAYAVALSEQIGRFKAHTFDDVDGFLALLAQNYGDPHEGQKGNVTLTSYDGLLKIKVQVADLKTFGAELQAAKGLVDACLNDWSVDAHPALRVLVQHAFDIDKEGKINQAALFSLLRFDIDDERWQRGMDALRDAVKVIGSKRYVNFYKKATARAKWEAVSIDAAAL